MAEKHYADHPDYAGEVDHRELLLRIDDEANYDGWLLHTSSTALENLLHATYELGIGPFRIMSWVKPFAVFKKNVSVAYAWEPVLVKACRPPLVSGRMVMRDWVSAPITLQRGVVGAKPESVCRWAFEMLGMEPDDELHDLYPGSGAVSRAWEKWRTELQLLPRMTRSRTAVVTESLDFR
jgi:hypothetical protein